MLLLLRCHETLNRPGLEVSVGSGFDEQSIYATIDLPAHVLALKQHHLSASELLLCQITHLFVRFAHTGLNTKTLLIPGLLPPTFSLRLHLLPPLHVPSLSLRRFLSISLLQVMHDVAAAILELVARNGA